MAFIPLNCPNCNGKIERKQGKTFKCPYCETELMLKENNVYYVDQTVHNYYGTQPVPASAQPQKNVKLLLLLPFLVICTLFVYFIATGNRAEHSADRGTSAAVRTMPESEVLLLFLRDVFDKGSALPTTEEIAKIRYLATSYEDNQWSFTYSFDDPFTNAQAKVVDYVVTDKLLNKQRIEQKDLEAFSGLTKLDLMGVYEITQSQTASFRHMQGLKSYGGGFNEPFRIFAHSFADKTKIVELSTQIRSNDELALLLEFPNLQSLAITYVDDSVTDFHLLSQLPLKKLSLRFIDQLKWLSSLAGLESLTVNYSEETDFNALYSLSHLQELKLVMVKNLKTFDFIQNMPNLQTLEIDNADITNIERLRNKLSLTKLRLASLSNLGSVEAVNSLTSLTDLTLTGYYSSVTPLTLPNLKRAELPSSFIPKLEAPALTHLTVNLGSRDLNGEELSKFPQLVRLSAVGSGSFGNVGALNRLSGLQVLEAKETEFHEETHALFRLEHVKTLRCDECRLTLRDLQPPANSKLESLVLNKPYFRVNNDHVSEMDRIMPYFSGFTALRSFTLQDSSLQSLEFMKNWQQVEALHLENNAIMNVEPLVSLPNLKKLYLIGNPVQNKSVLDQGILIY